MKKIIPLLLMALLCGCASKPKYTSYTETWKDIELRKQSNRIFRLESLVFESHKETHVRLLGMIESEGLFEIADKKEYTLKDLIEAAGGFKPVAYVRRVKVTRNAEDNSLRHTYEIDMSQEGILKGNGGFKLQPGDIIYVPEIIQ
jgi:hypothetical protein